MGFNLNEIVKGVISLHKDFLDEEQQKRKENFRKFINNKYKKRGKRR